jgi:CubicO group peptidase (beta-lactamase class C family)
VAIIETTGRDQSVSPKYFALRPLPYCVRLPRMCKRFRLMAFLLLVSGVEANCQSRVVPGAQWKQLGSPEQSGWSPKKLANIRDYLEEIGSTSAMIVQHGVVVAAWGDITHRSNLHSCRKSLLNSLIGIAVAEGKINLDDTLEKLGIDDNKPSLTADEKQATVRDLLEARSGVYHPTVYETKSMTEEKPPRGSHAPGTFWYYNNWDFNTLGCIYEKATRTKIFDAFYREIAQPIGMQDYKPRDGHYVTSADTRFPAYPFEMSARDLARFALFYLYGGRWNNTQIVPEEWVKESTRPYSDSESGGYGYLWWTGDAASGKPQQISFPKGSFWAEGHLGQYAVAVPSLDLIIVNRVDEKMTKRTVHKRQMAHLVQMVVAAAPAG